MRKFNEELCIHTMHKKLWIKFWSVWELNPWPLLYIRWGALTAGWELYDFNIFTAIKNFTHQSQLSRLSQQHRLVRHCWYYYLCPDRHGQARCVWVASSHECFSIHTNLAICHRSCQLNDFRRGSTQLRLTETSLYANQCHCHCYYF